MFFKDRSPSGNHGVLVKHHPWIDIYTETVTPTPATAAGIGLCWDRAYGRALHPKLRLQHSVMSDPSM
jgi:hypothetical protein